MKILTESKYNAINLYLEHMLTVLITSHNIDMLTLKNVTNDINSISKLLGTESYAALNQVIDDFIEEGVYETAEKTD